MALRHLLVVCPSPEPTNPESIIALGATNLLHECVNVTSMAQSCRNFRSLIAIDYRGDSLMRKFPPSPWDHPRTLGIVLLEGPRRGQFLISEAPL